MTISTRIRMSTGQSLEQMAMRKRSEVDILLYLELNPEDKSKQLLAEIYEIGARYFSQGKGNSAESWWDHIRRRNPLYRPKNKKTPAAYAYEKFSEQVHK